VNGCFGDSKAGLRTTKLGRFLPLARDRLNDGRVASETKFEPIAHCAEVLIARLARNAYKIWHAVSFPLANLARSVTYFGKACRDIWRTKKNLT